MERGVFVYGAGALGSVLGAACSVHRDVTLVGRAAHVEAIGKQRGLLIENERAGRYPLHATDTLQDIPAQAIILVTVKAFDLETALRALAPRLDSSHLVVVLQNGLGIRSLAEEILQRPVVRGVTFIAAASVAPGRISWNALGKTYFSRHDALVNLWRQARLPGVAVDDIEKYVWRKLAINAVINPLSALLRVTNGELLSLEGLAKELVHELVCVAKAEKQNLLERETLAKVLASMQQTASNPSSMLQDVRAGRPTEIDWINGSVVRLARKHGIEVPRHRQILDLVRFVTAHPQGPEETEGGRPLLSTVGTRHSRGA